MLKEWEQHLLSPTSKKDQCQKTQVPCPDVIKIYNKGMGDVDLTDQRAAASHLDQKSTIRFYLGIVFNLMDAACANSYIDYNMMHLNDLTLLDFKTTVSNYLIGRYTSRSRTPLDDKTGSKRKFQ